MQATVVVRAISNLYKITQIHITTLSRTSYFPDLSLKAFRIADTITWVHTDSSLSTPLSRVIGMAIEKIDTHILLSPFDSHGDIMVNLG